MYFEEAELLAYEIGLKPWEFWELSPEELGGMAEGYRRRLEHEYRRSAWMVAYLLNQNRRKGSKAWTPERLLGKDFGRRK